MTRRPLLAVLMAAPLVAGLAVAAPAGADHAWETYHWPRTGPSVVVPLDDNVSSAWDSYRSTSTAEWSTPSYVDTTAGPSGTAPKQCKPTSGRVEVCNDRYGRTGWLGIASVWASGSHITQGTVKLNDTYFATTRYNTPAWRAFVMCQEIGHTLGLDHVDEDHANANLGTCMDYTNDPSGTAGTNGSASNTSPDAHDYAMADQIHGHLDSGATSASASAGAANDLSQLGRKVRAKGRFEVYEQRTGPDRRVYHFVIRA